MLFTLHVSNQVGHYSTRTSSSSVQRPRRYSHKKKRECKKETFGRLSSPVYFPFLLGVEIPSKVPEDRSIDVSVISLDKLIFCRFFCISFPFSLRKLSAAPLSTDQRHFPFLSILIFYSRFILLCLSIFAPLLYTRRFFFSCLGFGMYFGFIYLIHFEGGCFVIFQLEKHFFSLLER